ncbi:MAG: ribonuclease III [Rhodospirillales bacterium]|jgi:ribonuclease-3|nr:ribonuclease III [Rhodospirillales bacterium]
MSRSPTALAELETVLGHSFADLSLLRLALRHASAGLAAGGHGTSNERLEFLGDRVLGLCVSELLCETFPNDSVGELARRHAQLVSGDALERVARAIGLPPFIRVGRGGGHEANSAPNPNIIADACEAVIAALYLDGGLAAAAAFVRQAWAPLLAEAQVAPKDPKTALQEWAQGQGLSLPVYEEVSREGPDHQPVFVIRVRLGDGRQASAAGPSKRLAEAQAAKALLAVCAPTAADGGEPGRRHR